MLGNFPITPSLPVTDLNRARRFYEDKLGLKPEWSHADMPFPDVMYRCGGGTMLYIYQRSTPTKADHTTCAWKVDDIEKEMRELRAKGIMFEEYDMPGLKTTNGIATWGKDKSAWFKDPDGNILSLAQMAEVPAGTGVRNW